MPERLTLPSEIAILPSFNLRDLIDQQQRGGIEARRRAARHLHLVDDLDAAKRRTCRLEQFGLAGRQRRAAAERHPGDVALGRPHERLGFGNEAGFVVDQPHARHGFDRGDRATAAVLREGVGGKADIAANDLDPRLVEDGILKGRCGAGGEIGFQRGGRCSRPRWPKGRPSGMMPGHHLLLHLKSPCIRCPAGPCAPFPKFVSYLRHPRRRISETGHKQSHDSSAAFRFDAPGANSHSFGGTSNRRHWEQRENKPLRDCQTRNNADNVGLKGRAPE